MQITEGNIEQQAHAIARRGQRNLVASHRVTASASQPREQEAMIWSQSRGKAEKSNEVRANREARVSSTPGASTGAEGASHNLGMQLHLRRPSMGFVTRVIINDC